MGVLDFLFEGQPPPSVTSYGQTTTNLPQWLNDYTQGLIGRANAVAAEPYQQYGGPRVASFTPDQNQAFSMFRGNMGSGQSIARQGEGALAAATQQDPSRAGAPFLGSASSMIQGASGAAAQGGSQSNGGLSQAMPFLSRSAQTYPGQASTYMSPYIDNVINRAADLGTRTFNERLMPQLNDQFVAAGQFGSTRHQELANQGARDITENIQSQSQAALDQAYTTGANIFGADMSRAGNVGQTIGSLGESGLSRMLQSGQLQGQLGTAMGNLGETSGRLSESTGRLGIDAAGRWGDLADQISRLNLSDSAGLEGIGRQQQQNRQQNLDVAAGDFNRQTSYPRETVDWMSRIIRGLPTPESQSRTEVGPLAGSEYGPSGSDNIAGLAALLRGMQSPQRGG